MISPKTQAILGGRIRKSLPGLTLVILASVTAGALAGHAMRWGPWAYSDSVEYIEAARNFADGKGLVLERASGAVVPMALRPPFYSILLASGRVLGMEMMAAAQLLDIILFMAFLLVLGVSFQLLVQSTLLTLSATLFALSAPAILSIYTGAMSEPLFLTLGTASLVSIVWYVRNPNHRFVLGLSALCAGLSLLSRFVGLTVVVAAGVGLLSLGERSVKRRIADAAIFMAAAAVPFVIWSLGLLNSGNRLGVYNLPSQSLWSATAPVRIAIVDALWTWVPTGSQFADIPYDPKLTLLIAFALGSLLAVAIASRVRGISLRELVKHPAIQLAFVFSIFPAIYALFLAASFIFVSIPRPALYERIVFPIPFALFIGFLSVVFFLGSTLTRLRFPGLLPLGVTIAFFLANLPSAFVLMDELHTKGRGFTGQQWQVSEVIAALRERPEDLDLISNQTDAIQFFLNRPAFGIPELEAEEPQIVFTTFGREGGTMADRTFLERGAALVLFDDAFWQFEALYGPATEDRMDILTNGLYVYAELSDGTIYFWEEASAP